MIEKFNFHTHTQFCDAKCTAEEIVVSAIEKNVAMLGFSGHSYTSFDTVPCMSTNGTKEYRKEIARLKEKYSDKIKIYLGIEQDYYADFKAEDYDFIIGSVHYIKKNGELYQVDAKYEKFLNNLKLGWNNDIYAMAEDYFSCFSDILEKTNADIIGHFDILTKYNKDGSLFNENDVRYVSAYERALKILCEKNAVFEINMGGIARGYTDVPYPSEQILKKIYELGGKVTISSDCHRAEHIDFGFYDGLAIAKKCGFKSIVNPITKENIII